MRTWGTVTAILFVAAALAVGACAKKAADLAAQKETARAAPLPGDVDCYKTAGAGACPPGRGDSTGQATLPVPGGPCTLAACAVCGSETAPAFRDATGNEQPGWCICVERSDGSGKRVYSCFSRSEWRNR